MKTTFTYLLVILIFPVLVFAQDAQKISGARLCSMKKSSAGYNPVSLKSINSGPLHSYDVIHYELDLDIRNCFISPYPKSFTGTNVITIRVDSTLNSIILDAVNTSLGIDAVSLAGTSFTHSDDLLTIQLDRTYNPGEYLDIGIEYHHKNVNDNAFYASNGMVFTDCEPEGARKWFPCWDKPSDKATVDIRAKVPGNVKLGSNGALADSLITGDTIYYHWVSIHNVPTYLVVLSGKVNYKLDIVYWEKLSNPGELVPIRFYYNNGENPEPVKAIINDMTTFFSESFCEHPFQKNGFATLNNDFAWGGMENQTLTSLCPGCWYESLAAHEFAHQWFGDMITLATWADIWLNEGFATWSEAYWYESYAGYAAYKSDIDDDALYYLINNPGWPISNPDWAVNTPPNGILFNYAITYTKGACVLHMLRYTLGDSLFMETLQQYCADTNLKYKSAVIPDFMDKVNQVTGENYDWFFNQWIYQPNHPEYQNTYNFEDIGSGQWKVNFFVKQVQANPEFFQMPVEIWIRFDDFTDTTLRVMNVANYQQFEWTFDKRPVTLQFDPDNEIVLKEGTTFVGVPEPVMQNSGSTLSQNKPNPATGQTTINYSTVRSMPVLLTLCDITGRTIRTLAEGTVEAGHHSVTLDCSTLPSGVYYYILTAGEERLVRKMIITQ